MKIDLVLYVEDTGLPVEGVYDAILKRLKGETLLVRDGAVDPLASHVIGQVHIVDATVAVA